MMTPMWSRWGSWAEWKAARFQKRSDMARCFYISRPNNPTKDTWPKLELKTTISIWGDEDSGGERLSHQVVGLTPLSMLPHCAWLVRARRDSLCSDRYQCASLLYNFPLYTTTTNSSLTQAALCKNEKSRCEDEFSSTVVVQIQAGREFLEMGLFVLWQISMCSTSFEYTNNQTSMRAAFLQLALNRHCQRHNEPRVLPL